ncbi:hypothetical protein BBJ28_00026805, partial [Nothophytophthora sp. Chile5]
LDSSNPEDVAAASRKMEFDIGWFLSPIVSGDYPAVMRERAGDRLPRFTPEQTELVKGSYDLFMLNHYGSKMITNCDSKASNMACDTLAVGWERDSGVDNSHIVPGTRKRSGDAAKNAHCAMFTAYPPGYLETIKWLHAHDTSADILLTENGWCGDDEVENMDQLWYFQAYLEQVHKAVVEEKIPVIGYTAWSFLDNYEWGSYESRFGLYYVNYSSQAGSPDFYEPEASDLARVPRPSAKWFQKVASTKCLGVSVAAAPAAEVSGEHHHHFWAWVVGLVAIVAVSAVVVLGLVWSLSANQVGTMQLLQRFLQLAGGAAAVLLALHPVATTSTDLRCFPDEFLFGSATAAYQVEGAVKEGGRTPSIWDQFCRERPGVKCANVADDFYHRYHEDVKLMVETGLQSFRFSISWSRVMNWDPQLRGMRPNPEGIAFYHSLIDDLNANGIVPILTLYHWDLPLELHTELSPQGWLNTEIADHYVEYATLMFHEYGGKVNFWTTFNEPLSFSTSGYTTGREAPGFKGSPTQVYTVIHNVLLSHAKAVQQFRKLRVSNVVNAKARIGIVLNADFAYPLDSSNPEDVAAASRKMEFDIGWFLSPIVSGDYPAVMRERAGDRLPRFTPEQ